MQAQELTENVIRNLVGKPKFDKPTSEELEKRYLFQAPKSDQGERCETLRIHTCSLAKKIVQVTPCSPEQTRALNALDEALSLAILAITRNE